MLGHNSYPALLLLGRLMFSLDKVLLCEESGRWLLQYHSFWWDGEPQRLRKYENTREMIDETTHKGTFKSSGSFPTPAPPI